MYFSKGFRKKSIVAYVIDIVNKAVKQTLIKKKFMENLYMNLATYISL